MGLPFPIGDVRLSYMSNTNLSKSMERIIRQTLPGPQFAATRKVIRQYAADADFDCLRNLTGDSGIVSQAAEAVIAELERAAKERARTLQTNAEIAKAIKDGCPCCSRAIKRNLSLTGWWQCSQFGAVGFRADSNMPACNWQAFYVEVK